MLSGTLASGAAGVGVAAGAVPPLGAPCASATPAGRNTRAAADAATITRDNFSMEAPVPANSFSGAILLRPQPTAHRDFGEADGHGLALPDPAAGREDEGQPAAVPIRTESGAGGGLGIGDAEHDEADEGQRNDGGGEHEVFAGPPIAGHGGLSC